MSTRRDFIKQSGLLVVGLERVPDLLADPARAAAQAGLGPGPYPDLDFRQLDSWIVVRPDNTATFYVGKTDLGQGTGTAFRQIMADELDIAYERTSVVMGTTDVTVDQGGSGGSDALQTDGWPMRRVAAEARRVLLDMASTRLGVPAAQLAVSAGVVSVAADPSKRVTYGELIGGRRFNVTLRGDNINATTGQAPLKAVQDLKIVGQSPQRDDIPAKVDGSLRWAVDVKLPGMVHARNVKPPFAGATLVSIDESSVKSCRGSCEWSARATTWRWCASARSTPSRRRGSSRSSGRSPRRRRFPTSENLFDYMRSAMPTSMGMPTVAGTPDAALAGSAKRVEAEYEVPFQGHVAIGPAHAMADPSNDQMTIYSNDMKSYGLRDGVARFLQMPRDRVRVVWMEGPQAYGRTAADDAGFEAAFLAKEIGRPVRVQWMRNEETAWDTKGPAFAVKMRGGLDAAGQSHGAWSYEARVADHNHLGYNEPDTVLIAQLTGQRKATPARGGGALPSRDVRDPATGGSWRTSSACRWCGRRRCAPATCAIPTGPRWRLPPSRSWTNWRPPRAPTRWPSA